MDDNFLGNGFGKRAHDAFLISGAWSVMWFLYRIERGRDTAHKTLLRPGKTYTVGRKDTDIKLAHDKSVSRQHASISVETTTYEDTISINHRPCIKVHDSSKYGTFINERRVTEDVNVNELDIIKFGTLNSLMRLRWEPIVLFRDSLKSAEKKKLFEQCVILGVKVSDKWRSECTHMYVTALRVTSKVLISLVNLKPIVSTAWLQKMVDTTTDDGFQIPEPILPPIEHDPTYDAWGTPDFSPQSARESLFASSEFWFFNSVQFERNVNNIQMAHGKAKLRSSAENYTEKQVCAPHRILVIPPSPADEEPGWATLVSMLQRRQRRPISHDEIGWAIIYCSTSLLCNPTVPKAPAASAPREQTPISPPAVPQSPPAAPHSPPSTTQGSLIRESASLADMFDDFIGDDGPRSPPPAVVNTSPPQPAPATTVPLIEPSSSSALDATSSSTPASLSKKRRQLPFSSQNIEPLLSQTMEPQDSVEETSTRRTRPRLSSKEPHETTAPQHLIADTEPGGIDIDLDLDLPTTTVDMDPPRETVTVETHNESRGHPRETTPLALPQTPRGRGTASKRQNKRNTRTTNIPTSALNLWNDNEAQASEHAPESGNDEEEEIIPGKQYSVIEFAAIVRPPAAAPSSHSSNEGINYKRFRKVQPIQPPDFMDFVPMTLSDAEIRTRQEPSVNLFTNTDAGNPQAIVDPDIQIRVNTIAHRRRR